MGRGALKKCEYNVRRQKVFHGGSTDQGTDGPCDQRTRNMMFKGGVNLLQQLGPSNSMVQHSRLTSQVANVRTLTCPSHGRRQKVFRVGQRNILNFRGSKPQNIIIGHSMVNI